jgi:hypothetical protein
LRGTQARAIRAEQKAGGAVPPPSTRQLIWEHFKDVLVLLACEIALVLLLELAVAVFPSLASLVEKCERTLEWGAVATITYLFAESIVRMAISLAAGVSRQAPRMGS